MRAIVLAAGQGTRLMPLTRERPKCMVPLLGRALLHRLLDSFAAAGVHDVVVVAGYEAAKVDTLGRPKRINAAYATTNMVETLFAAADCMDDGSDFIVSYADTVFEPHVIRTVLEERHGDLVVASDDCWRALWSVRMSDPLGDAETFRSSADGRIAELGRKPSGYDDIQGQYMGLFMVRGSRVADFKTFYRALDRHATFEGQPFAKMFMTSFLQALIDAGWHAQAARTCGGWLEVDSIADLEAYEKLAERGELERLCRFAPEEIGC